nr:hypothetical protein CFP56_01609 [Quercus suber]
MAAGDRTPAMPPLSLEILSLLCKQNTVSLSFSSHRETHASQPLKRLIAREPKPELWKEPDETEGSPRVLDAKKLFYYHGESLRQALADDLHQRLSTR